jgi:LacI family transcriptional regulator
MYGDHERVIMPIEDYSHWKGDGVIVQHLRPEIQPLVAGVAWPVINVSDHAAADRFVSVIPDNAEIGRLAARHFFERGFRNFGYCGFAGANHSKVRGDSFAAEATSLGCSCAQIEGAGWQLEPQRWPERHAEIAAWIRALPRPAGVFCCNDIRARHVAQICADIGVRVPEELALLGVDNDELVCEMGSVAISSIDLAAAEVGYQAAAMLDQLAEGAPRPASPVLVHPAAIVTRRSSDMLAIADSAVVETLRYIHEHAQEPIGVEEIARAATIGRRVLERRFKSALGRTIGQQLASARINRAKQLLTQSDLPAPLIAERCGFRYVQQFNATFRRVVSMTPTAYRRQFRMPDR